jgi:uncharacterized protein involved in outer membrane biogenesis
MKKLVGLVLLAGLLFAIAGVAAFFYLGPIVRAGVEKVGPQITKVPVKLGGANISVWNGKGELHGFVLGNPEGYKTPEALRVGTIAIDLVPRSVLGDKVIIRSIRLEAPEITYEAGLGGSNIGKVLENIQAVASQEKSGATNTTGKPLQVDEIVITGGKINVSATALGGRSASLPLPEIRLTQLGQGPEGITAAELSSKALGVIVEAAARAAASGALGLGKSAADAALNVTTEAKDRVKNIGSGISDLFKSKSE